MIVFTKVLLKNQLNSIGGIMKIRTRIISVVMIMMMIVGGMSFGSFAATASKGTVYVTVTQDNAKAQNLLTQINKQRSKRGLRKLTLDKSLTTAAVQRSAEITMVIPTTSPHRRPDGRAAKTVHRRATRENCAEGYYTGPKAVCNDWMSSKNHKATILLKSARSCGIAYVTNPADENIGYYVLIVSNSKAKKKLTSKKTVTSTKTVVALSKYIKKKYFSQDPEYGSTTLGLTDTSTLCTYYAGPKTVDFTAPRINAKSFKWTSSDTSVATVSAAGVVTAVAPGTVTISAKLKKGPAITLSKTYTVDGPEAFFDKLTDNITDTGDYNEEDGYGYTPGSCYMKSYFGMAYAGDDPETGEETIERTESAYAMVMEARIGEELALMYQSVDYDDYESREAKTVASTFMIVSKNGGSLDDTVTFIYDYTDGDNNCIYKLKATAPRGAVDLENLQWEVIDEGSGEAINYDEITDQVYGLFRANAFYLRSKTGVKPQHLGIKSV